MDRPTGGCRLLVFPLWMVFNCPPNMCHTLNPLDQLHKKWILRNVLKHRLYTAHWTVLAPIPLSIWTMEDPSIMTTLTASAKSFTGGPNALKSVSSFTTQTMRHIRQPTPSSPTKNVTLSYPHKIDWRRLTSVWYVSLIVSETLKIYIYSSLTVWRQSIDRQWYEVCELKYGICLPTWLSICLRVCLFVYQKGILP